MRASGSCDRTFNSCSCWQFYDCLCAFFLSSRSPVGLIFLLSCTCGFWQHASGSGWRGVSQNAFIAFQFCWGWEKLYLTIYYLIFITHNTSNNISHLLTKRKKSQPMSGNLLVALHTDVCLSVFYLEVICLCPCRTIFVLTFL